jgi:hypothetical protein
VLNAPLNFSPPVSLIIQEVTVIPGVEHGLEEEAENLHAAHIFEATVGGMNAAPHNAESPVVYLLAEQIILGIQRALVESAKPAEYLTVEQHEHAGAERLAISEPYWARLLPM